MQFHPNDLSDLDELTEEHLGFSALSDGLGFSKGKQGPHPATQKKAEPARAEQEMELDEEDLAQLASPASPAAAAAAQERARQMSFSGTGAVAAGPMRPAPLYSSSNFTAKPKAAPAPAAAAAPAPTAAKILAEPAAARWMRATAFLLDGLFVSLPLALAWYLSFGRDSAEIFLQDPRAPLGLFAVIFAAYFLLSESFGGQSLGKMALGLRVVEDDKYQKPTGLKHAVVRLILFVPGTLLLGIGLLASFWDSKRRPWHDRYSNSIVRRMA